MSKGWSMTVPLLFAASVCFGQPIRFSEFFDLNQGAGGLLDAVFLDNGDILAVGNVLNLTDNVGYSDGFHVLVNTEGELVQSNGFASLNKSYHTQAVVKNPVTNSLFSAGYFCDFTVESPGYCDFYISKLDATGDTLFTKVLSRPDTSDFLLDMVQTRPNKLMLIGWTYNDTIDTDADLLFITVDTLGNELNRVVYGGGGTDFISSGVSVDNSGEVIMAGYTKSYPNLSNSRRTWIMKTDSIGNVKWHRTYSGPVGLNSSAARVTFLDDGNILVVGGNDSFGGNDPDGYLMKTDTAGNQIWAKEYPVTGGQGLWGVVGLEDGSIVSCGVTDAADGSQAGWLIKADENGDTLWTRTFNASQFTDYLRNMIVLPNGDIVMVGFGRAPGQTNQDGWILRVDSMGCLQEGCFLTSLNEELEINNEELLVYPNPATETITIEIESKQLGQLQLFDATGRLVFEKRLISNREEIGVGYLPRGVYVAVLYKKGVVVERKKLVLQ